MESEGSIKWNKQELQILVEKISIESFGKPFKHQAIV